MPEKIESTYVSVPKASDDIAHAWHEFNTQSALTSRQAEQFRTYFDLLMYYNKQFNLTAITSARGVIKHHFTDSLMVSQWFDVAACKGIVDVGTGAGFPALPLKIMYPHLPMILIEPNGKKRKFLELVAQELGLEDVQTCPHDWRTFIRTTESELDLFVSRAALPVDELCRMFKPSSAYKNGTLAYWASELWQPEEGVDSYISGDHGYRVGSRKRRLIFLKRPVE